MRLPARKSDPATSHAAAAHVVASGAAAAQQELTATAVKRYPGCTALELSRKSGIDRYVLGRRLSECEKDGTVERGQPKKCSESGRSAHTWYPPGAVRQLRMEAIP